METKMNRLVEIADKLSREVEDVLKNYRSWDWGHTRPADEDTPARIRDAAQISAKKTLEVVERETSFGDSWGPCGDASDLVRELEALADAEEDYKFLLPATAGSRGAVQK